MNHGIKTSRLYLRPMDLSDCEFIFDLDAAASVRQFLLMPSAPTRAEATDFVMQRIALHQDNPQHGFWIVLCTLQRKPIGWIHLKPSVRKPNGTEIGWRFLQESWGNGYALEASNALLAHANVVTRSHPLVATCLAENRRSIRVMEKLNMVLLHRFLYLDQHPALMYIGYAKDDEVGHL